jgi:DNA polymerase III subunit gamma/tau
MAVQSLYRRYRPRRFSEVKGQEHVVRSLRNAVLNHREGQAYLFSGPRGTGKTTSARILAKVLNCENPIDGEPCCACSSCLAVEAGTSYDVHELDAASNNGVDAMRDLIEKTSLGTPGRHKVYILDEVHMLSKAAEAALLKTLEEPPPHVVFVLATTDPQKVSDTIRSRTQHLQFHLLAMDVMENHIRWLAEDAGLDVTDQAVQAVLRRGGGSARDTISALELIAAGGGDAQDETPLDEFVESLIESDPGRALAAVAAVVGQGRDSRTLTESLIVHLRDCFLSLMAPELVQLPDQRAAEVSALGQRLGAAATVRAMEVLGSMLVEMRHAPDPRVLLEVALIKLTNPAADPGTAALVARLDRLEQQIARGGATVGGSGGSGGGAGAGAPGPVLRPGPGGGAGMSGAQAPAPATPSPRDPTTGRALLGGRGRPQPTAPTPEATPAEPVAATTEVPGPASEPAQPVSPAPMTQATDAVPHQPAELNATAEAAQPDRPTASTADATVTPIRGIAIGPATAEQLTAAHSALVASLRPLAKAVLAAGQFTAETDGAIELAVPSDPLKRRAEDQRADIERALSEHFGRPLRLVVRVDAASRPLEDTVATAPPAPPTQAEQDEVDLSELVDAPAGPVVDGFERIAAAFPGSELIEERE